ncbi:hypothetical protein VTN77DRAFT_4235 [Rasamsonia byssochlamydoides]|uniref:uncharacterized protein n=1 Tax=Rasamsonia byssochlamydoides TaxID=89139 RepID=UPI0037447E36
MTTTPENHDSNPAPLQPSVDEVKTPQPPSDDGPSAAQTSSPSGSAPGQNSAAPSRPKKKRSLLLVPTRTSSRGSKHPSSDVTSETVQDESGNARSNLRTNLAKRRRDRSKASSRRSQRNQQDPSPHAEQPKISSPEDYDYSRSDRKSKASTRFFAILNCCSSSRPDNEDPELPAKRAENRQTVQARSPSTVEKADGSAAESSTADSKEHSPFGDEKTKFTVDSDASKPQTEDEPGVGAGGQDAASRLQEQVAEPAVGGPSSVQDQTVTQRQQADVSNKFLAAGPEAENKDVSLATVEEEVTSDQTRSSQDLRDNHDITMTDAPATQDAAEEQTGPASQEETVMQQPVNLPPPGPPATTGKEGRQWLLPPPLPHLKDRKCLVLDLDETLVHSSFKVLERADFTIPVEIEGQWHNIYVIKRPGVDQFMKRVGELYEVVVFTASVSKYGDPLLDQLDIHNVVHHRLFRDSCYNHQGNYVKDLSQVGRDLKDTIIIDNSPTSYIFHPQHAIPISSWFSDAHDNELLDLIPVLEDLAGSQVQDVSLVLDVAL